MMSSRLTESRKLMQAISLCGLLAPWSASAAEGVPPAFKGKRVDFPTAYAYPMNQGEGYDKVQKCAICHSFGYILNQGRQSRTFWDHETQKMISTYKAPISPEEAKMIVNYLSTFYGNGKE